MEPIPIKLILVGSLGVGKTSLIRKFYLKNSSNSLSKTIKGSSYIIIKKKVKHNNFVLQIWDTAGQEKFKSLSKLFTKNTKIAILVYSIDSEESFNELDEWLKLIVAGNDDRVIYGLAGNKSDLASENTIPDEKGLQYAKNIGAIFKSTSAITENGGIEEFIDELFNKYIDYKFNLEDASSKGSTLNRGMIRYSTSGKEKVCC